MAKLLCAIAPPSFIPDSSTHKPNFPVPIPGVRCASAARNVGLVDRNTLSQGHPQTHLVPPGSRGDCVPGANRRREIDDCASLLNQLIKSGKHASDCRQIHAKFLKSGDLDVDGSIREKLAMLYSYDKGSVDNARKLLDEIIQRTAPLYAVLIGSFCRAERWEDLFLTLGSMLREGMLPDRYLVPTILKACSATQLSWSGRMVHGYVTRKGLESEIYVGNALIDLYANCGELGLARSVFETMQEKDVVSWTTIFSAYMDGGLLNEAEEIFQTMQLNGVKPDSISWNALISGFARNGEIDLAYQALEKMQGDGLKPGVRAWNAIITGCVRNGYFIEAMDALHRMLCFPEDPNAVTIVSILPVAAETEDLDYGRAVYGCALKRDLCWNRYVQGSLINMYSKCREISCAEKIFAGVKNKDTAMLNEMVACYVNEGRMEGALGFLRSMQKDGFRLDAITYNTVLGGYARRGQKKQAFRLLSEMLQKGLKPNTVTFNVLVSGFQQSGLTLEALKLFRSMQSGSIAGFSTGMLNPPVQLKPIKPNQITMTGALAACADLSCFLQGKEIHGHVIRNGFEHNIYMLSALVDMYAKCDDMDLADKVFRLSEERNTVAWNAYLVGHANTRPELVGKLFHEMVGKGHKPSFVSFTILLAAYGNMAALRVGKELHGHIIRCRLDGSMGAVRSGLIELYAKCGCVEESERLFDPEAEKDVGVWNAMASAYTVNHQAAKAFALFGKMGLLRVSPDHSTFTALLTACSYEGLVEEGWDYFNLMKKGNGIVPGLEHYVCMVSILGGARLLREALELIERVPHAPNAPFLRLTLLQACMNQSNLDIGEAEAAALSELHPTNPFDRVLYFNKFAPSVLWDSRRLLKSSADCFGMAMEECSYANVGNEVHRFVGRGRGSCSSGAERLSLEAWNGLSEEVKTAGFSPLDPITKGEREAVMGSCLHTEKLAVCFGIASLSPSAPIRVSKNARMCVDCHETFKIMSVIRGREIFVKDVRSCHRFEGGTCSCSDRW